MSDNVTTQIIAESPLIEQQKLKLLEDARRQVEQAGLAAQQGIFLTPDYRIAGMSPDQTAAIEAGRMGIGAYQPYLSRATQTYMDALGTTGQGLQTLQGADTRRWFPRAYEEMIAAGTPINRMGEAAEMTKAARLGEAPLVGYRPDLQAFQMSPAERVAAERATAPQMQTAQTGYAPGLQAYQMGPAERIQTQTFAQPGSAEAFMSPYMQNVVNIQQREAQRQADIAATSRGQKYARAGAFGGARQAIENAEAARNLAMQKGDIQAMGTQQAYQQAQQQFNQEQQARLAAQQANQQAGLAVGQQNLASQLGVQQLGTQTGLQTALANLSAQQQANVQNQAAQLQTMGMNSEQAMRAALANQQAGLAVGQQNLASQLGVQQLGSQQAMQAALADQAMRGQYGIAGTQAGLQAAQQLAGIYGQQSQLRNQYAQGIAGLAGQEFGIGQQLAQGMGQFGTQQGSLAGQIGNLGAQSQAMGQQDVNFLYNLGAQQQRQTQAQLDAERQNVMQRNMQPYQQLGFLSDIYKGAPTANMAMTQQSQAQASPFQQIAGLGIAGVTAGAAGAKAGLF
jgi:hypothetical protein